MLSTKNLSLLSIACLVLISIAGCSKVDTQVPEQSQRKIISQTQAGDYTFQYWNEQTDEGETLGGFQILLKGKPMFVKEEDEPSTLGDCSCVSSNEPGKQTSVPKVMLADLTGDGTPVMLVRCDTGGAQSRSNYYILALGKTVQQLGYIEAGDSDLQIQAVKGSKVPALVFNDWSFAYWNSAYADSPAPEVALQWKDGAFRVSQPLMRDPPPSDAQFQEKIKQVKAEFQAGEYDSAHELGTETVVPPEMWEYMLDLIYSGNGNRAWEFFDQVWPENVKGKEKFKRDFKHQLAQSKYWPDIKSLNDWN